MSEKINERVIIEHMKQPYYGCKSISEEVNKLLEDGWKIKSVTAGPTPEGTIVIFVLTKRK